MKKILLFSLLMLNVSVSVAFESTPYLKFLKGHFEQGGYIHGETVPFAKLTLGEQKTTADELGKFFIGIERLAKPMQKLEISVLEGDNHTVPFKIKTHEYKTQYIKGVKDKHVTPRSEEDWAQIKSDTDKINAARSHDPLPLNYILQDFSYPVSGTITGVYGSRRFYNGEERSWHKGYDFAEKTGTPIHAPQSGIVRLALPNSYFNGNLVIVEHGYGMMTLYAHLNSINVKEGQEVQKGDILGTLGSTGRSTGPHLHFGLYWGKMALNPMLLYKEQTSLK